MPRILIADDDPVSLRFLRDATARMGCAVVACVDGASTLAAAANAQFDLLLLDLRLPDIDGRALLAQLRAHGAAAPAIATTAELDPRTSTELLAHGFVAALEKPIALSGLEAALRPYLPELADATTSAGTARRPAGTTHLFDDQSALTAVGGDAATLAALRGLLARELEALLRARAAGGTPPDPQPLHERLHRLRASCGFCGATALAQAAAQLGALVRTDGDDYRARYAEFLAQCRATLEVLAAQGSERVR